MPRCVRVRVRVRVRVGACSERGGRVRGGVRGRWVRMVWVLCGTRWRRGGPGLSLWELWAEFRRSWCLFGQQF